MFRRLAGIITSGSALSANAFLLPPNVAPAAEDAAFRSLAVSPKSLTLHLPCSDCAFSYKKQESVKEAESEDDFFIAGGANSVVLNFTISEDGKALEINGGQIYPIKEYPFVLPEIYVHQVPAAASHDDFESGAARSRPLLVTGSGFGVIDEKIVSPGDTTLTLFQFHLLSLGGQRITLDAVNIQLLETLSGQLSIAHGEPEAMMPPQNLHPFRKPSNAEDDEVWTLPHRPHSHDKPEWHKSLKGGDSKGCNVLPERLCKLKHMIESKISGMRTGGCHGHKGDKSRHELPSHIRPHFARPGHKRPGHGEMDGRLRHGRPHKDHHGHQRHHFMHTFSRGLAAVLVPTMAGVAVGMTVSLMGLVVGRMIGYLWITLYRGGRRRQARVALDESQGGEVEEKVQLMAGMEGMEAPPVYEDAPAYEAAGREEK